MKTLEEKKREAIEAYKEAKREYLADCRSKEKFYKFCDCKRACMLLGCRI